MPEAGLDGADGGEVLEVDGVDNAASCCCGGDIFSDRSLVDKNARLSDK